MFHLQIMIGSTYKNSKMVSREMRTRSIHFTAINHYLTPSKLLRLTLRENPKGGMHSLCERPLIMVLVNNLGLCLKDFRCKISILILCSKCKETS